MGTVIARNDAHHSITVLDSNDNVVQVKFNGLEFAKYKAQISIEENGERTIVDKSWLGRGCLLILTGYRRDDTFVIKTYKNSIFPYPINLITEVKENGEIEIQFQRYGENQEENA